MGRDLTRLHDLYREARIIGRNVDDLAASILNAATPDLVPEDDEPGDPLKEARDIVEEMQALVRNLERAVEGRP